jgi:calcineurin-like phosphoesterase family protein
MKKWITSDLHFGHDRIRQFCPETRGRFTDVIDMREKMIAEWNQDVKPEDEVFILGDFAFLPAKDAVAILRRLNGSKILVEGNHDRKLLNDPSFRREFKEVHQYLRYNHDGTIVIMLHYPIFDHDQAGRGSIMLHGHRHGNPHNIPGRIMDVGFDATGKVVSSLDEIVQKMQTVQHMYHHK